MKKLISFLGLFLINNSFAYGGPGGERFLLLLLGGAFAMLAFLIFHIIYSAIMAYMSPKGKKLNTFIWAFFIPPFFWFAAFYLVRFIIILISPSVTIYTIIAFMALVVVIVPVGLYYLMKKQNFFNNEPE